jgi:hypothetical protein
MQGLTRYLLPLLSAPLLASCVFLLDYDELQKGKPAASAGGQDGQAGSDTAPGGNANAPGGANAGGAGNCGECDDKDPCTIDTCDETGATPTCMHEATEGLKLDGLDTTLVGQHHVRLSLVGSGQFFYLASLDNGGNSKLSLYRLASDGGAPEPIGTDLSLEGVPVSNVGLAIEELALGEVALHGFVATKLKLANAVPRVFHVEHRNDQTTSTVVLASSFLADNPTADDPTVFPQALTIGGKVFGAWIQENGTIAVHDVTAKRTDTFGSTSLPVQATTLSLLSTADDKPAVMFTAQSGTYVETSGQNRAKLTECETRPGVYRSSSAISTQIPGVWLANVTRYGDGYLTNGNGTLVCGNNQCVAVPEDCAKNPPGNALRDVAGATVHFPQDAAGVIYSVVAVPQIAPKTDDPNAAEGRLSLVLGRVDLSNPSKAVSTTIGGDAATGLMEIAHNDTSEALAFAGPDWPAVSILPTQQVAVAWIQPNAAADGTELRLQRYKMCLPPPP